MQRLFRRGGILFLLVAAGVQIGCMAQSPPPAPDHSEEGFVALFNGEDLTGWEGDFNLWKVEDGMLVGRSPGIEHNNFLATGAIYENFILKFSFHLVNGEGNSGVQFAAVGCRIHMKSPVNQADIGEEYWGSLYDESRRNRVLVDAREAGVEKVLKKKTGMIMLSAARGTTSSSN